MAPSIFQLFNLFGRPSLSDVACRRTTNEELIIWYLGIHTWLLGTLLAVSLLALVSRSFRTSSPVQRQPDETLDSSASNTQHPVNGPDVQPQGSQPCLDPPRPRSEMQTQESHGGSAREGSVQANMSEHSFHSNRIRQGVITPKPYPVVRCGSRQRNRDSAQACSRESRTFVPMYELGDTRLRRRRQWDDVLRGIRGGAGDEAEINSQNEHAPTTNEPDCRDDQDSERYLESMSEYLELEDLLEATINDLDELESHHDGTLLREALVRNERRRLRRDYRELRERLDHHMRLLGLEPEDLDTEEGDALGRSGLRVVGHGVFANGPSQRRRRQDIRRAGLGGASSPVRDVE
ncbi:uncharacterized protein Z520_00144 [Fonsecaea multimorphosa CBS 102226]|uniref:Uncharacterized protein n=1 Tax=Fonsecaea multimorphosa CBS 102226 TaxID=1442371 RepID=A0A0D2KBN4_9EURO|nr:uncharacterized protein Z520_00144 [Fonsecaea multimorphosa CBS 102226]KIY03453.1 hypothetical protein Z520_00144 [Fonsecaea multimorphosa CBS 102226]